MAQERIIPDVQRECEMRLNSDPFFTHISVINYRKGDIAQEMVSALAGLSPKNGRAGTCVVILQPVANSANRNIRFAPFETRFSFLVLEFPLFNDEATTGTGVRAETICRRILDLFGLFHPVGITTPFVAAEPFMIPTKIPVPTGNKSEDLLPVAYECSFIARESRGRELFQPALPSVTQAGATVTLACATESVDMYYTLDGSPPAPPHINPAATLYTAPFDPVTSCIIRVVAMRQQQGTDWTPSDIAIAEFDVALADNLDNPLGTASEETILA